MTTRVSLTSELSTPMPPGPPLWPLQPAPLTVYRCSLCGTSWLHAVACCGRRPRPLAAPYYVASVTPAPAPPKFSVILLTHENRERVEATVASLRRIRGAHSVEFVFIDGCSRDDTLNFIRDLARRETVQLLIRHPEEPFVAPRNRNRAAQMARGRFLLFARAGVEVTAPDCFDQLQAGLTDSRVGVVGYRDSIPAKSDAGPVIPHDCEYRWSAVPVSPSLWGVRAEVFAELGGLDEGFLDTGQDAVDFQYRALGRNFRLAALADAPPHDPEPAGSNGHEPDRHADLAQFSDRSGRRLADEQDVDALFGSYTYPRISVAIAARDYGHFLPRALDSVLGCYLPAGERRQIVVVNDASRDETARVMEEYRLRHPEQITILSRPVSRGSATAKNDAMTRCIGDFVAPLDADDEFLELKLWRALETLQTSGADFLYHDCVLVRPDGTYEMRCPGRWSLDRWRNGRILPPTTWVFRNGLVRFCEAYGASGTEDPEFLKRHWRTLKTVYLPESLSRYYAHGRGLSAQVMNRVVAGQLKGWPNAILAACADFPTPG